MRQTITPIVVASAITATAIVAAAITVTAAAAPQDAALTYPQRPRYDAATLPALADRYSPALSLQLDQSDVAVFDNARVPHEAAEPSQAVSLGKPAEFASLAPPAPAGGDNLVERRREQVGIADVAHGGEPAPADTADLASAASADLAPADLAPAAPSRRLDIAPARPSLTEITRIEFSTAVLGPVSHTVFCLKYPDECKVHKVMFRGGAMTLTAKRWNELTRVNAAVNRAIIPHPNTGGLAAEKWLIAPKAGECHDYAVTKRHDLIALGWPERDLLLAEVITSWGEHHLVLVARTSDGDLVADSLTGKIRDWSSVPYEWVRIQKPDNPTFWAKVASKTVWVKATGLARHES